MDPGSMAGIFAAVVASIITGAISGALGSQRTIAALLVHIDYLRNDIKRHDDHFSRMEQTILRAHERIDRIEKSE
jgi:hypothetical protein